MQTNNCEGKVHLFLTKAYGNSDVYFYIYYTGYTNVQWSEP
jgi:hypothetical protein